MDYVDFKSNDIEVSVMESLIKFKEAHKPFRGCSRDPWHRP